MLVRLTLVLMMALLCSKPEHELPHQPQFLPSPRNLSITGLLRWALFYFAAPYCPTSMARCLIFFLVLNGGGAIKNTSYLYVIAEGEEASLPCRVKNLFQHYTVREVCTLCYAALDSLFGRPMQWWYWMSKNATPNSWNEISNPPLKICAGVLDKSLRCDSSLRWPSYFLLRSTTNFLQTASYVPLLRSQFRTWTNMVPLLSNLITVRFPDERFSVLEIPRPRWCWSM